MAMTIKDIYEKAKDVWPVDEPLDFAEKELAVVPDGAVNAADIQRVVDWVSRIRKNYPELYVSQADDIGKK